MSRSAAAKKAWVTRRGGGGANGGYRAGLAATLERAMTAGDARLGRATAAARAARAKVPLWQFDVGRTTHGWAKEARLGVINDRRAKRGKTALGLGRIR